VSVCTAWSCSVAAAAAEDNNCCELGFSSRQEINLGATVKVVKHAWKKTRRKIFS
jgi:hypothetical protein